MYESKKTGYPSIDKPWLKYYTPEAIATELPQENLFDYLYAENAGNQQTNALVYFGRRITYKDLFSNVERAARAFWKMGIRSGDVVTFVTITTPEMIYAFYALNSIGAAVNMLDPRSSAKTKELQTKTAKSKMLIVLDECAADIEQYASICGIKDIIFITVRRSMGWPIKQLYSLKKHPTLNTGLGMLWDDFLKKGENAVYVKCSDASSPALIAYTGGTTGDAKGVLLTNKNINAVVAQYKDGAKGFAHGQSWLTIAAPFIAYALIAGLHMPLVYGMECNIELYDPDAVAKAIIKKKYNHVAVTPIIWEKLIHELSAQNTDFSFLIAPTSGADHMSEKLESDINSFLKTHRCQWKICQGYGMTEVGSAVSVNFSDKIYRSGSVGIPLSHTVISAFDVDTRAEKKLGETGEICIAGPSVMTGYYENRTATEATLICHEDGNIWMHTGDLGHIDKDGFLYIDGRIKRMITRFDGFKVFPAAVEEKILTYDKIENCAVVGVEDTANGVGQLPVAFVVPLEQKEAKNEALKKEIKDLCVKTLPEYACPIDIIICGRLPLTTAGKVNYRALEEQAKQTTAS